MSCNCGSCNFSPYNNNCNPCGCNSPNQCNSCTPCFVPLCGTGFNFCNPCVNPCNPCGNQCNPCNPCNPCNSCCTPCLQYACTGSCMPCNGCDPCGPCDCPSCKKKGRKHRKHKKRCSSSSSSSSSDDCKPKCRKCKQVKCCCKKKCGKCKKSKCCCIEYCCSLCVKCGCVSASLTKSVSPLTYTAAGQTITYSYLITNTGSAPICYPITINDDKLGGQYIPFSYIPPGGTQTFTRTYITTPSDMSVAFITNTAIAFIRATKNKYVVTPISTTTLSRSP